MLGEASQATSVFEIGSTLREARTRQGLELSDAQRATRIRAKYLAALENEQFDKLPAEAYARGFLRTYADFLGLDSARYVAELDYRLAASRPPPPPPPERSLHLPSLDLRAAATLTVALAVVAASVLAWRLGGNPDERTGLVPSPRPPEVTTTSTAPRPKAGRQGSPALARLVVTAELGSCWLSVRAGSADGRVLYEGTLQEGDSVRFARKRLWVRMGAPWALRARLNGKALRGLPPETGNVLVTPAGVRPAY
jgi:cytoskeleton protein RodZ